MKNSFRFKVILPTEYCNPLIEYIIKEVAVKDKYVADFKKHGSVFEFNLLDWDLFALNELPISKLGYSRKKENFAIMEWTMVVNYLIGEYWEKIELDLSINNGN
jgi:hypothetical protein